MKIHIAYRFTGEDPKELDSMLTSIKEVLESAGHAARISFFHQNRYEIEKYSVKQIMDDAFQEIDGADMLLAVVKSPEKSEGMLIEIGYARARNKRIVLALKEGLDSSSAIGVADDVLRFADLPDLYRKLRSV